MASAASPPPESPYVPYDYEPDQDDDFEPEPHLTGGEPLDELDLELAAANPHLPLEDTGARPMPPR